MSQSSIRFTDRTLRASVAASFALLLLASGDATLAQTPNDPVTTAALGTWVHGVTDELAEREVGVAAVPKLIKLLEDPTFPRRDNVVAFLGHLGGPDATRALVRLLQSPSASLNLPQEDRALLLAPQALGLIAKRRDAGALDVLLDMTEHGGNGGVLAAAAAKGKNPASMRDDLLEMALRGLGHSGDPRAKSRLQAIASGQHKPAKEGRDQKKSATIALELFDQEEAGSSPGAPPGPPLDGLASPVVGSRSVSADAVLSIADESFDANSNHTQVNDSLLSYANHPSVTNPMTDARLDQILASVSLRMGKSSFPEDIACCSGLGRSGSAKVFAAVGDGLDVIDTSAEVSAVLNNIAARIKVVRVINYCGSAATNIIGCGWIGGKGIALVRYGDVGNEGALWAHEYGHNVGLQHNTDNRFIMYGCLCGNNYGLSASECDRYHTPSVGAGATLVNAGACTDVDADQVQDEIDNCPGASNNSQTDSDLDGIGDACEGGCGNGLLDSGEECDGNAFGGATCASEGMDGGNLTCTSACTIDTRSCTFCGDGVRQGSEQCDGADLGTASCGAVGCTVGAPSCGLDCKLSYDGCGSCPVCDNDGTCEASETCGSCGSDCVSSVGAFCGNGVCEPSTGEDCLSCKSDCAGVQTGKTNKQYCCGDGAGRNPKGCGDALCQANAWECSNMPTAPSCCGDSTCGGVENGFNCALDCGAPTCDSTETSCTDRLDNDCDGFLDCTDSNCGSSAACAPACKPKNSACTSKSECCSNNCKSSGVCG